VWIVRVLVRVVGVRSKWTWREVRWRVDLLSSSRDVVRAGEVCMRRMVVGSWVGGVRWRL
jgi:hypothetical protein